MTKEQHREIMGALNRIAEALEKMANPFYTVTFEQPPVVDDKWHGQPWHYPQQPNYVGDPLPSQRPQNIC